MITKICGRCGIEKVSDCFGIRSDNGNLKTNCKPCAQLYTKEYYKSNKEKISIDHKIYHDNNKEKITQYTKEYRSNNKEKIAKDQKEYWENNKSKISENGKRNYKNNKDKISKNRKEYRKNNKDKISENKKEYRKNNKENIAKNQNNREKERKKTDPAYKLRKNISGTIARVLKSGNSSKAGHSILEYLPYSFEELKNHIEALFESWMTWENHGNYKPKSWDDSDSSTWKWQLDHIIPQSDLPYTSMTDENFKTCWDLSNLRPLSAKQNNSDGTNRIRHKK